MNIWIDIAHMPQYNFYKPLIEILSKHGHHVLITILDRGRLVKIMQYELSEFPNVHLYVVGKHRMKKISAIIDAISNLKSIKILSSKSSQLIILFLFFNVNLKV